MSTRETRQSLGRLRRPKRHCDINNKRSCRCCFQCENDAGGSSQKKVKKESRCANQRKNENKGSEKKAPRLKGKSSEKEGIANASKQQDQGNNKDDFEPEWEVSEVQSHWMDPEKLAPYFKVKYTGWKGFYFQPLSDLQMCPGLVEKMEEKTGLKMRKLSDGTAVPIETGQSRFPAIPEAISKNFNDPGEEIISGEETLLEICSKKTSDQGTDLWTCSFREYKGLRHVRRGIIEYYWPVESACFWTILEKRRDRMTCALLEFFGKK